MTVKSVGPRRGLLLDVRPRGLASLALVVLFACLGACTAVASAHTVPEGSSLWFACTEQQFNGPHSLDCPQAYDPQYLSTFLGGFNRFTPENEFQMVYTEPQQNKFDFNVADQVARFAVNNHMTIRGHSLLWWNEEPFWLDHPLVAWSSPELRDIMSKYISTVVGHFASSFPATVSEWDVVNEPLDTKGNYIPDVWDRIIGPGYIAEALADAHDADPYADLVINDEGSGAPDPETAGMIGLATQLKQQGAPLNTIGFEAHVTPDTAATLPQLLGTFNQLAKIGVNTEITELDVSNDNGVDDPAAKQAVFETYAEACEEAPNCTGYTVWGVADQYSWLSAKTSDALLYDDTFAPTAAVSIVKNTLDGILPGTAAPKAALTRCTKTRKKHCVKAKAAAKKR